jgi:hypothetical protein
MAQGPPQSKQAWALVWGCKSDNPLQALVRGAHKPPPRHLPQWHRRRHQSNTSGTLL